MREREKERERSREKKTFFETLLKRLIYMLLNGMCSDGKRKKIDKNLKEIPLMFSHQRVRNELYKCLNP